MAKALEITPEDLQRRLNEGLEGITLEQLVDELAPFYKGTKRQTLYIYVQRYLRQGVSPRPEFLAKYCLALRISPEWLLLGHEPMRVTSATAAQQFFLQVSSLVDAIREKDAEPPVEIKTVRKSQVERGGKGKLR